MLKTTTQHHRTVFKLRRHITSDIFYIGTIIPITLRIIPVLQKRRCQNERYSPSIRPHRGPESDVAMGERFYTTTLVYQTRLGRSTTCELSRWMATISFWKLTCYLSRYTHNTRAGQSQSQVERDDRLIITNNKKHDMTNDWSKTPP